MNAEQFIQQQIRAGFTIHQNQGVWWQRTSPCYCKPVLPFQELVPGEASPKTYKALFAYTHIVPRDDLANRRLGLMLLSEERLRGYCLEALPYEKRKAIRKAQRGGLLARRIDDVKAVMDDLREICISTAKRTGYGRPPDYYVKHQDEWRTFMRRTFSLEGREWWGVFTGGRLVAYLYGYLVEDTMILDSTKFHTDFLSDRPSDLLHFTVLEHCRELRECRRVSAGNWVPDVTSINRFKETHGFEKINLPVYSRYNQAVQQVVRAILASRRIRVFDAAASTSAPSGGPVMRAYRALVQRAERMSTLEAK